jgi:hypothetical protein
MKVGTHNESFESDKLNIRFGSINFEGLDIKLFPLELETRADRITYVLKNCSVNYFLLPIYGFISLENLLDIAAPTENEYIASKPLSIKQLLKWIKLLTHINSPELLETLQQIQNAVLSINSPINIYTNALLSQIYNTKVDNNDKLFIYYYKLINPITTPLRISCDYGTIAIYASRFIYRDWPRGILNPLMYNNKCIMATDKNMFNGIYISDMNKVDLFDFAKWLVSFYKYCIRNPEFISPTETETIKSLLINSLLLFVDNNEPNKKYYGIYFNSSEVIKIFILTYNGIKTYLLYNQDNKFDTFFDIMAEFNNVYPNIIPENLNIKNVSAENIYLFDLIDENKITYI